MIEVVNDVPFPVGRSRIGWPHEGMQVGESFFVDNQTLVAVCNANQRYAKKLGMRFTAKKVDGGIRVWRIK
jgi:hypothetical protein